MSVEIKLDCNTLRCLGEVDEHFYCEDCFNEKLAEAKKEGYDEGYEEGKNESKP